MLVPRLREKGGSMPVLVGRTGIGERVDARPCQSIDAENQAERGHSLANGSQSWAGNSS
jgi:hypothetical protein